MPHPEELRFRVQMVRTAKQLPEVSRTVVWGSTALCLAGLSAIGGVAICPHPQELRFWVRVIRTANQLPEVSRTGVWGRAALGLAGASCEWWGCFR
jgi:hypothetical protein